MTKSRVSWEEVRPLVEEQTGRVITATAVHEGFNSHIAVILDTERGTYFIKGIRRDHPRAWTQERERTVNPAVRHISPYLKWAIEDAEWNLLGFEYIAGRSADYSPGSVDLPRVMRTMLQLQRIPCPDIEMKRAEDRWADYTEMPDLLGGKSLLHTDWHPTNILLNETRAYLVDWAWPTRGAAWIDPACWAVWLIASGHRPGGAEAWAARIPSWSSAPAGAITEFTRIQAAMWAGIADNSPDDWIADLAHAAEMWAKYRESQGLIFGEGL